MHIISLEDTGGEGRSFGSVELAGDLALYPARITHQTCIVNKTFKSTICLVILRVLFVIHTDLIFVPVHTLIIT